MSGWKDDGFSDDSIDSGGNEGAVGAKCITGSDPSVVCSSDRVKSVSNLLVVNTLIDESFDKAASGDAVA